MPSAFTSVTRGASPSAASGNESLKGSKREHTKRTRQLSNFHAMVLDQVNEDATLETECPTINSTSASDISSKASNSSEPPPLLDFIGTACMASAWFTSCFPCAVVDFNDRDNNVVDKLSRESAMNVMYSSPVRPERPEMIHVPSIRENEDTSRRESGTANEEHLTFSTQVLDDSQLQLWRDQQVNMIEEEEDDDDSEPEMETVSLIENVSLEQQHQQEKHDDLVIIDNSEPAPAPIMSSPKRKKFSFKPKSTKFPSFGRKKQ